jgi:hypothetical protein
MGRANSQQSGRSGMDGWASNVFYVIVGPIFWSI